MSDRCFDVVRALLPKLPIGFEWDFDSRRWDCSEDFAPFTMYRGKEGWSFSAWFYNLNGSAPFVLVLVPFPPHSSQELGRALLADAPALQRLWERLLGRIHETCFLLPPSS